MARTRWAYCSTMSSETPSRGDVLEESEDVIDDHRREAERRLVNENHARLREIGAHEREHLLLAAAQCSRELFPSIGQLRELLVRHGP